MKIIYNNIIPFEGYSVMNICGVIFARKRFEPLDEVTINHEAIHTAQMKELGYLPFYIIYGVEYLINLINYPSAHKAYRNISFEKEAYEHEKDLEYLKNRKHYAQWKSEDKSNTCYVVKLPGTVKTDGLQEVQQDNWGSRLGYTTVWWWLCT